MKAILEFNLPDDASEYKISQRASDYLCVLIELDNSLRNALKYGTPLDRSPGTLSEDYQKVCEDVRSFLFRLLEDHQISLDEA